MLTSLQPTNLEAEQRFSRNLITNALLPRHKASLGHFNNDKSNLTSQRSICRIYDDTPTTDANHFYDEVPNITENKKRFSDHQIVSNFRNMAKKNDVLPVKSNLQISSQTHGSLSQISAIISDSDEEELPNMVYFFFVFNFFLELTSSTISKAKKAFNRG